jgi:uncharacterized protein (DUF1015 family)
MYAKGKVELSDVVTPPYDVIDPLLRDNLEKRSLYNFVRIDLPDPSAGEDRYRRAADILNSYRANGTIRQDDAPAVYRYHQVFRDDALGRTVTRKGILAAVQLTPWSSGFIRPHEATFPIPRQDRALLLSATRVHLSPVFAMYDDPRGDVEGSLKELSTTPDLSAKTDDGTTHLVWRITDDDVIDALALAMRSRTAYVLDGHHRYETMVGFDRAHTSRGLVFFVPSSDSGLIIRPTHRVVHGLPDLGRDKFLAEVQRFCRVSVITNGARDASLARAALATAPESPSFVAVFPSQGDAYLLSVGHTGDLKGGAIEVSVLHDKIVEGVLGISGQERKAANLRYTSDTQSALDQVDNGAQLALLMRPPTLTQIMHTADRGEVMPEKSTYFFPKLASGLVMMPVD